MKKTLPTMLGAAAILVLPLLGPPAGAQSFDDTDVPLCSWSERGRAVDLAVAQDGTLIAAYVYHHQDALKNPDELVVTRSRDKGATWTELYRAPQGSEWIKEVAVGISLPNTLRYRDRWVFVALHQISVNSGQQLWDNVNMISGPLDMPWTSSNIDRCNVAGSSFGGWAQPPRHGADLHLSLAIAPYRDTYPNDYLVAVAHVWPEATDNIYVDVSLDYGHSFTKNLAVGPGRLFNGQRSFAHPSISADVSSHRSALAFADPANQVVHVADIRDLDLRWLRSFQLVWSTPGNDGRAEHHPMIAANQNKMVMTCLTGAPGRFGEHTLSWFVNEPATGFRERPVPLHRMALSAADVTLTESAVYATAECVGDTAGGKAYPVVHGFQGLYIDPSLPGMQVSDSAVLGTIPKVEAVSPANWYTGVYAYCMWDDWDSYEAFYVMVDPGR